MKLKLLFIVLFISGFSWGQQTIASSGTPVTETFSSYSGTSSLPANWTTTGAGTNGNAFQSTTQITGSAGGWYGNNNMSYLGSGSASNGYATWKLQNNTGATITSFDISFLATLWKSGLASPTCSLTYSTNSTGVVPVPGALTSILTFNDATTNIATGTTLAQTISSISIPNGDYIYIRFFHLGGSNSDNIGWDDVSLTCYSCVPAPNPSGSITISANPSCGAATLTYSPGYYWETTSNGTSFASPTSSSYILNSTGTIFVRNWNGTCWSSSASSLSSGLVIINQPISITTQPANASVSNGNNTSFSVVATNATGYQWYINTGSGFTLLSNGGVYTNVTTATLNITGATLAMNTYQYQCAITGTAPCGNTTSSAATLAVINPLIVLADNGVQVNAAFVPQSTLDVVLHKFKVDPNVATNLTGIANVVTSGTYISSDIINLKVRYSVDNILDAGDATLSTYTTPGVAGSKNFPGFFTQAIAAGTTGYIFITADVSATAVIGNTINLNAVTTANLVFSIGTKSGSTTIGGVQTFSASAPAVPTNFTKGCTTNTTQALSWAAPATGTFNGYILVVRQGAVPNAVTSIVAATQPNNLNYTLAPTYNATPSRVLYIGTGTSAIVTGLTQGLSYTFALYAYKNSGASSVYSTTATTITQTIGLPDVSSASTTAGNTSGTATWVNPAAACYDQILVVVTSSAGITFTPTGSSPTAYTANTVFSGFNQPVYYSSGNLVNITGLTNGVTYYLEIFIRNGSQWSSGVEVSLTPINVVPTILKTGDLVLIAYNNNLPATSGDDGIRLLTMVDINPGTKFLWANATYETGGNPAANVRTDKWFNCTAAPTGNVPYLEFTYNGGTVIPAASTFCITTVVSGTSSTISAVSPTGVNFPNSNFSILGKLADGNPLPAVPGHGSVNVSTSNPDSMFLLQGNFSYSVTGSTFIGTVLSAVQDGGAWYDITDNLTSISGANYRKSRKHPQLYCASIQANLSPASYQVSYNVSTTTYTTGNRPYLLGSILNYTTNWITSFGSCPATSPFVITASDPFNKWNGNISTNWFDCNNWALLTVPDELTDVSVLASASRDAVIDYTAPYSDGFLDLAKCKTLTISGRKVQIEGSPLNKLEVHEDLIIDTTGSLDMDDSNVATVDGIIYLYRNWSNTLGTTAFLEGNGTVDFIGSATQVVNSNVHSSPETFYNVILDNDFNTATSNNLIASGNLEVKPNKIVSINSNDYVIANKKLTNTGSISIFNNGQFIQVDETDLNDGDYTGTNFQVYRTAQVKNLDYVYWSAPTENFAITSLPTNNRYEWNTLNSNPNGTLGNWNNPSTATMTKGRGYIARASNGAATPTALTATFIGKPYNGQFTYPIYRGNYTGPDYDADLTNATNLFTTAFDDNWNLVGNPYPSAIDAMEFINMNAATNNVKMVGAIWVWKHGIDPTSNISPFYQNFTYNYSTSDYIKFNAMGSSEPTLFTGGKIASGQGFMINMSDELSAGVPNPSGNMITFNNNMRTDASLGFYNNTDFFKSSNAFVQQPEERHRMWLDIFNNTSGQLDRTLLGYATNATLGKDNLYDCFTRPTAEIGFYSLIENKPYAIQGRPLPFDNQDLVPMGIKIIQSGSHTIAINAVDGLFAQNQDIFLEDKLLNVIHDLKQAPYVFNSEVGTFNDRFVIRYTNAALSTNTNNLINSIVVVATNNSQVTIKSINDKMISVVIYDLLGREIVKKDNVNLNEIIFSNITAKNQALIVKIKLENDTIVTRKIIL